MSFVHRQPPIQKVVGRPSPNSDVHKKRCPDISGAACLDLRVLERAAGQFLRRKRKGWDDWDEQAKKAAAKASAANACLMMLEWNKPKPA